MQLFHFIAAWLFPGAAKVATTKAMTAESSEHDNASSLAFSVKAADDDSGSSISSSSSSPSSSSDEHPRFFTSRHQQQKSPPASPLCFGAGGAAGRFLRGSRAARARSPTKKEATAANMAPAPTKQGDVVGRYLRRISRRLRKARMASKGSSPAAGGLDAVDDTARERAEGVARAISYCKDTLRRGAAPSLNDLLHGRQDEIVASAAAYCIGSTGSKPPPPLLQHRAGGGLAEMQAMAKQGNDSNSTRLASQKEVVHGKEVPRHGHDKMNKKPPAMSSSAGDLAADELGSFDDMEFLKIFDGDEEMIAHHFITVQL